MSLEDRIRERIKLLSRRIASVAGDRLLEETVFLLKEILESDKEHQSSFSEAERLSHCRKLGLL